MTQKSIGENPAITLRSNWLMVNGTSLRANALRSSHGEKLTVSAAELENILLLGRYAILKGIESFYAKQTQRHTAGTLSRPSIWAAQLGTIAQTDVNNEVFTELGDANGGVITTLEEIQPQFHAYWNAVREAGLLPEVRRTSGDRDGGSWLALRKPSLDEVLHHWFGYPKDMVDRAIETIGDESTERQRRKLHLSRLLGEKAVDRAPDGVRSREQIGLILSMAAIRLAIYDRDGYDEEVSDAFTYIDNNPSIDASTVRAIENSTFE